MYYYRFTASTPYSGTDMEYYYRTDVPLTDTEIDIMREEFQTENAVGYEYLVTGWDDEMFDTEEEREDALEDYYCDCYCECEEITREEYEENA